MIIKKLMVILLSGAICLLGITSALAELQMPSPTQYNSIEEYEKATGKKITKFNEAPVLRIKVAAGELPPVEERLPEEPLVVEPVEEIGQYGGTWHRAWIDLKDICAVINVMSDGGTLIRISPTGKILPNLAKSWEISENGKVYTFHLRKGVKWSDGHPFTADDILFAWEDILQNKEITPVFPTWSFPKETEFEKIDDYTIRFRFPKTNATFLTSAGLSQDLIVPKHYAKQFHPRYVSADKLKEMTKEAGFENWYDLFHAKVMDYWMALTNRPTLWAWKLEVPAAGGKRMVHVRNPYYWKVDTEGNQLPYIDRVTHDMVGSSDLINMKAMTGEIDFQKRHIAFANYTLFMENQEEGNYRVLLWKTDIGAKPGIFFNYVTKDPVLRKIFQNDKFRKAASLAINRDEINELCFLGMAEPRQASIASGAPYYDEEWEKAYAEYDPEKANALLDEIGLTKRDKEGFRLRPDGKTLSVTILFTPSSLKTTVCELLKEYWEAIGIKVALDSVSRQLRSTRMNANEFEVGVEYDVFRSNFPMDNFTIGSIWACLHEWWYFGRKGGVKPTGDLARVQELRRKYEITINEEEKEAIVKEMVELHKKNIWVIGAVGETPEIVIVKNNFRNVPDNVLSGGFMGGQQNAEPEQFFIKQK